MLRRILKLHRSDLKYRQSGWLCTRWGEIAQSLNFKYFNKCHCKSCELLGFYIIGYPLKAHNSSLDLHWHLLKYLKFCAISPHLVQSHPDWRYWNYCSKKGLYSIYSNKINYIHEYFRLPFLLEKYQILYYFLNLMTPAEDSSARTNLHVPTIRMWNAVQEKFL